MGFEGLNNKVGWPVEEVSKPPFSDTSGPDLGGRVLFLRVPELTEACAAMQGRENKEAIEAPGEYGKRQKMARFE